MPVDGNKTRTRATAEEPSSNLSTDRRVFAPLRARVHNFWSFEPLPLCDASGSVLGTWICVGLVQAFAQGMACRE